MSSRVVITESDRDFAQKWISSQKLPFTMTVAVGKHRSVEQNKLQRLWLKEISEQLGDRSVEEIRGYCKLTLGVPILRQENEAFRVAYDRQVKSLPYEQKMALMMEPLDLPVTRIMTVKQKKDYLDAVHRHWSEQGVILTDPDPLPQSDRPAT